MNLKIKNIVTVVMISGVILILGIMLLFGSKKEYSDSERRKLESFPDIKYENIISGDYMTDFESASTDNFPFRDYFRKIKAYTLRNIFFQKDNNDIYTCDGHISKLEYPLNYDMLNHASEKIENIYKTYFENSKSKVYFSIIPDKNMFLAENHLSLDYYELFSYMKEKNDYMEYIDITDLLSDDDYYFTDSHWRQECIVDIAKRISDKMGTGFSGNFNEQTASKSFYGVYYGQSALSFQPDNIKYLTNDIIENCDVTIYPNGKPIKSKVYNTEKLEDKDPYEFFLSGSQPIVSIDNHNSGNNKKLIIFRDSFGSSIAPLLIEGYSNITLVDTRYIEPAYLRAFIDINADDVLFIYSTLILNSSLSLR